MDSASKPFGVVYLITNTVNGKVCRTLLKLALEWKPVMYLRLLLLSFQGHQRRSKVWDIRFLSSSSFPRVYGKTFMEVRDGTRDPRQPKRIAL